jgi:DNA-binding transcriptional ArsR family regulator
MREEGAVVATAKRTKKRIEDVVQYALGHKTRVQILIVLNEGIYTAAEIARRIDQPQTNITNHLSKMLDDGSIEIANETRKGNLVQYWYKAVEIPVYSTEEAEAMTPVQRQMTVGAIVQSGAAEVFAGLQAGKLAEPKSILFWDWYNVDAQGKQDMEDESHRYLDRLREIEAESTNRRAESREEGISMLLNLSVFERARKVRAHLSNAHR